MSSNSTEIEFEFPNWIRVFKDGSVYRSYEADFVPPSEDPQTKVLSKDVKITPENNVSARIYLPKENTNQKLPVMLYIHGGGFCLGSAFSSHNHIYVNKLVAQANVIAVSVEYRLAPEHSIPACYDDSFSAFKWLVNQGSDSEPWLRDHADFSRIFVVGESAGANIAHDTVLRASLEGDPLAKTGVKLVGMVLIHPSFGGSDLLIHEKRWMFFCKYGNSGLRDPRLNPGVHPDLLQKLTCNKILICTAQKDFLRSRGSNYYAAIKNSGWSGQVELEEAEGEDHAFHLNNQTCQNAEILMKRIATFLK